MAKISSKSVPVIAALALLAGVFSVASAHAATVTCLVQGPGTNLSCNTVYQKVQKGFSIKFNTFVFAGTGLHGASATGFLKRSDGTIIRQDHLEVPANFHAIKTHQIKNTTSKTQSYRGELMHFKGAALSSAGVQTETY